MESTPTTPDLEVAIKAYWLSFEKQNKFNTAFQIEGEEKSKGSFSTREWLEQKLEDADHETVQEYFQAIESAEQKSDNREHHNHIHAWNVADYAEQCLIFYQKNKGSLDGAVKGHLDQFEGEGKERKKAELKFLAAIHDIARTHSRHDKDEHKNAFYAALMLEKKFGYTRDEAVNLALAVACKDDRRFYVDTNHGIFSRIIQSADCLAITRLYPVENGFNFELLQLHTDFQSTKSAEVEALAKQISVKEQGVVSGGGYNSTISNEAGDEHKFKYEAKPYGVLGTDIDYDKAKEKGETAGNSAGLNNRRNFVIVDPAGKAFKDSASDLGGDGASGAIYAVRGNEGETIAKSRPTSSNDKEGITKDKNGLITKIENGYAVFNNVWKPDGKPETPAGVIHAVGPCGSAGVERQKLLTQTLKNIFIEYHRCTSDNAENKATDSSDGKPGLRIPAISANIYAGTDEKSGSPGGTDRSWLSGGQELYSKRLKTAIEQGYIQACKELSLKKIDFGSHGLEICSYSKSDCDAFERVKGASAAPELPEAPELLGKTAKEVFEKTWRYVYRKAGAEGEEEEEAAPATAEQRAFLRDQLSIIALNKEEEEVKRNLLEELLKGNRQNDATELLGYLLEAVTDPKIATVSSINYKDSSNVDKTSKPKTEDQHKIEVPITADKGSFSDLLNEMQKAETLSGDDRYIRPEDEVLVDVEKTIKLQPKSDKDELVFSLKRFKFKSDGRTTKISDDITLDEIELDVLAKAGKEESEKKQRYEPTAFIVHSGKTLSAGHYKTYIKEIDGDSSAWFVYDDNARGKVTETELDEEGLPKVAKQAYVVKYSPLANPATEGVEPPQGAARYKSGLPESQTNGTENKGNQCFGNAAFAFLLSMTSLKPTTLEEQPEQLKPLEGLVTEYNVHLKEYSGKLPEFKAHLERSKKEKIEAKKPLEKTGVWKCSDTNFQATPSTTIQVTYCKPLAPENLVIGKKTITQYWKTTSADQVIAQRANNFRAASIYDLRNGENNEAAKGEIIQTHLDVILLAANEVKKDGKSLSHDDVLEVITFAKENGGVLNTQKPNAPKADDWMVDFSRIYQEKMKESGIFTGRQGAYKAVGSRLTFLPADVLEKIQQEDFKGKFADEVKTKAVKEAEARIADKTKKMETLTRRTGAER